MFLVHIFVIISEKYRILNEELEAFESQNQDLEEELLNLHEANTARLEQKVNDYDEC